VFCRFENFYDDALQSNLTKWSLIKIVEENGISKRLKMYLASACEENLLMAEEFPAPGHPLQGCQLLR
jgi:hypothetical protein